jgi:signal transduction histidine kinase
VLWLAAIGTWLAVGGPIVMRLYSADRPLAWIAVPAWLAFGAAFVVFQRCGGRIARRRALALLALQTGCAIVVSWAGGGRGVEVALLVMTASQTAAVLSWRGSLLWIALQTAAVVWPSAGAMPLSWLIVVAGVQLGFQVFAVGVMQLAVREARAREELAEVNAELRAAQALAADHARLAERLRIARDLHDSLGHHLTALGLSLEVASHLAEGRAAPHVSAARDLTKLLLAEVRDVVSAMRDEAPVDLEAALHGLARGVSAPHIHLDLADGLGAVSDSARANAVLRCVQEIVTNALRHAQAANLWIEITRRPEGLRIHARDDGRGAAEVQAGHGLGGMRERLEQAGGRLEITSAPGRGFELTALLPLQETPA